MSNTEYNFELGLNGNQLTQNLRNVIGTLEQVQDASVELGRTTDAAFNRASQASQEFEGRMRTNASNLRTLSELGRTAGRELADSLSGRNANSTEFERKLTQFKEKLTGITANINIDIPDDRMAVFQRQIDGARNEVEELNAALNIARQIMVGMDTNSDEFRQLAEAVTFCENAFDEFDDQMRQNEETQRDVQRSNRTLGATFEDVYGELQPLSTRLGEIEDRLYEMALAGQQNTQEFRDLQNEAVRFRQTIQQVDASVDNFAKSSAKIDALVEGANGLVGAFAAVQGVVGLVAGENEELEAALLKVNSAMAILQGLQAVSQVLNKDSAFAVFFLSSAHTTNAAATAVDTAATQAQAAANIEQTAAAAAAAAAIEINSAVATSNAAANYVDAEAIAANTAANAANTAANATNTAATGANTAATGTNALVAVDAAAANAVLAAAEAALTTALVAETEAEVAATAATLARITANTEEAITAEAAALATLAQATAARQLAAADVQAAAGAVAAATANTAQTVSMGAAAIAANVLGFALKAIGIGLIITAIAALVEYWDELTDAMKQLLPAGTDVGKTFDKIKSYAFGVGEAILKYLINPFKAAWQAINGDFKGAWETAKAGFDVITNFQTGFQRQEKRNQEKYENEKEEAAIKAKKRELERRKNRGDDVYKEEQALFERELKFLKKTRKETDETQKAMEDAQDKRTAENRKKAEAAAKKAEADRKKAVDEAAKKATEEAKKNDDLALKYTEETSKLKLQNQKETLQNQLDIIDNEARLRKAAIIREGASRKDSITAQEALIAEVMKQAEQLKTEIRLKAAKEEAQLQMDANKQIIDLKKDGVSKELDLLKLSEQEQIQAIQEKYEKDKTAQVNLIAAVRESVARKEKEINAKHAAEKLSLEEQQAIVAVELSSKYAKKTEETERQKQIALLRIRLEFAQKNLQQINDDGTEESKLAAKNAAKAVQDAQQAVDKAIKENKNRDFDWLDFLGIGEGLSSEDRQKLRKAIGESMKVLSDFTQFMIDNYQQQMDAKQEQIDQTQQEIDDLESRLEDEKDLREQGLANNVEVIEAEIAEKERQKEEQIRQEEELLEKKKAMQKVQLALDTVTQLSGLITASVNIFEGFSSIPIVGIPLAIAMIGLMFGTFIATKAKAVQAINQQTVQHGEGGEISGRKHSQGGEKYYNADGTKVKELEDGEFVIKARQYSKFKGLVRAINDNNFSGLSINDYAIAEMFSQMGFDIDAGIGEARNLQIALMTMGYSAKESRHLADISQGISELVESDRNTPKSWSDGVYNYLKKGNKVTKTRIIQVNTEENEHTE